MELDDNQEAAADTSWQRPAAWMLWIIVGVGVIVVTLQGLASFERRFTDIYVLLLPVYLGKYGAFALIWLGGVALCFTLAFSAKTLRGGWIAVFFAIGLQIMAIISAVVAPDDLPIPFSYWVFALVLWVMGFAFLAKKSVDADPTLKRTRDEDAA